MQWICVTWPINDSCCKTSWRNLLIIASALSGGNPVATARVDLSASSSVSFTVVRFACSSCSSRCSMVVNRFVVSSMKVMEDRICCISWSFVLFVCASIVSCVVFVCALSVDCSSSFKAFLYGWIWSWGPLPRSRSVCWTPCKSVYLNVYVHVYANSNVNVFLLLSW